MRSPVMVVFLVLLIAPATVGAQATPQTPPAAPTSGSAPAPADVQARAPTKASPAKSRNFFGQAMAELTRSVEASRATSTPAAAAAPASPPPAPATQVAAQNPPD